ncbi:hypothetical protein ACTPOK_17530 [Streptomyces inhibens]
MPAAALAPTPAACGGKDSAGAKDDKKRNAADAPKTERIRRIRRTTVN